MTVKMLIGLLAPSEGAVQFYGKSANDIFLLFNPASAICPRSRHNPDLLILDEPLSGLDAATAARAFAQFAAFRGCLSDSRRFTSCCFPCRDTCSGWGAASRMTVCRLSFRSPC